MEQPLLLDSFGFEIQQQQQKKGPDILPLASVALMLISVAGVFWLAGREHGLSAGRKEVMATVSGWTSGTTTTTGVVFIGYGDAPKKVVTSGRKYDALTQAFDQWRKELGALPIQLPTLYEGSDYSCTSLSALACAHLSDGSITVASHEPFSFDLRTVLMHEIGHLLGVPHIDGDPLMNAEYSVKLDRPTGASIALAKLAIAKKKRPS